MLAGLLRIADTKVQSSQLVRRPSLRGLVADSLCSERATERANEIEPAERQHAQSAAPW